MRTSSALGGARKRAVDVPIRRADGAVDEQFTYSTRRREEPREVIKAGLGAVEHHGHAGTNAAVGQRGGGSCSIFRRSSTVTRRGLIARCSSRAAGPDLLPMLAVFRRNNAGECDHGSEERDLTRGGVVRMKSLRLSRKPGVFAKTISAPYQHPAK